MRIITFRRFEGLSFGSVEDFLWRVEVFRLIGPRWRLEANSFGRCAAILNVHFNCIMDRWIGKIDRKVKDEWMGGSVEGLQLAELPVFVGAIRQVAPDDEGNTLLG